MDIRNVLLFTTVCVLVRVDATLHIEKDNPAIPWTTANTSCILATPSFEYNNDGTIRANIDHEDLELEDNKNYWIGYLRAFTVYHYLDCVNLNTSAHLFENTLQLESSKPDLCYSYCSKYDFLGISCTLDKCTCYCFKGRYVPQNVAENKQQYCTRCQDIGCGGMHLFERYVSLYIAVINPLSGDPPSMTTCILYDKPGSTFSTIPQRCIGYLPHLCETDKRNIIANTNQSSWVDAANNCFKNSTNTVNSRNKTMLGNAIGDMLVQFWTGLIGIPNVIRLNKDTNILPKTYEFGYLTQNSGNITLAFGDNKKKTKHRICMTEYTTTASSTIADAEKTTFKPKSTRSTSISENTITASSTAGTDNASTQGTEINEKQRSPKDDPNSSVGLYVGVVVACLVCICIAVCLVMWRNGLLARILVKRAKARPKSNPTYEGDTVNSNDVAIGFGRSNVSEVHNYEKVDSVELNTNANTNDYDFAKEVPEDTETDNTYNHINSNVNKQKNYNKNNTYDTASSALQYQNNIKDNTYDTTPGSGFAANKTETENVYNKLNDPIDNTYSHLNTSKPPINDQGGSTYDTSNSPELNTNSTDNDEYSHINTPHGKNEQQEDNYAKANFN